MKAIGQTKHAGFQFGIRRTFPCSLEDTWDFLFSTFGISHWLGQLKDCTLHENESYHTSDDFIGLIKVLKPYSHIRLTWKKPEWQNTSTIQIRCIASAPHKTIISIHQEKLDSKEQREEMKEHWTQIIDVLAKSMSINLGAS